MAVKHGVKILGNGELTKKAHGARTSLFQGRRSRRLEALGGTTETL